MAPILRSLSRIHVAKILTVAHVLSESLGTWATNLVNRINTGQAVLRDGGRWTGQTFLLRLVMPLLIRISNLEPENRLLWKAQVDMEAQGSS